MHTIRGFASAIIVAMACSPCVHAASIVYGSSRLSEGRIYRIDLDALTATPLADTTRKVGVLARGPNADELFAETLTGMFVVNTQTQSWTKVADYHGIAGAFGEGPEDAWYGNGPVNNNIYTFQPNGGSASNYFSGAAPAFEDLVGYAGELYAAASPGQIYRVNHALNNLTLVADVGHTLDGMAISSDGRVIAVGGSTFYNVSIATGQVTVLGAVTNAVFGDLGSAPIPAPATALVPLMVISAVRRRRS